MSDQSTFERTLEGRLLARAARADRPFDASVVARAAIDVAAPRRDRARPNLRPAFGWLAVAGLLALIAVAGIGAAIGGFPPRPGSILLAVGSSDGLTLMERDGPSGLHPFAGGPAFQPRWSPDGEFVAVTALTDVDPNHLLVYRADGTFVSDVTGVTSELEWSVAGHDLAVQSMASSAIAIVTVDDGTLRTLPMPADFDGGAGFSWSPDGDRIVVAAHAREDGTLGPAWLLDAAAQGPAVRFGTDDASGLRVPRWSPDGTRIASVERCPNGDCIRIRDAVSGQRRAEVMALTSTSRLGWSPDGAWLAFDSGGDLFIASSDVETVTPLTGGPSVDRFVEWAPDGQSVVIWRTVTAGGPEPYEFWSVPIDGSEPTLLASDAYGASIQPGGAPSE